MKRPLAFVLTLLAPFTLLSCRPKEDYLQMEVPYVEHGGVVETTADFIYEQVITLKNNFIFMIGVSDCAVCTTAVNDLHAYSEFHHFQVFYIKLDGLSEEEYGTLRLVTIEYGEKGKALPAIISESETVSLPMLYLFYQGYGFVFTQDSFTVTLDRHVKVSPHSD